MTTHEQKYDDLSTDAIRFSKDDFKQQQADVRRGTKQQQPMTIGGTEFILQESIIHDSNQPTTGSLSGGSVAPTPANAALAPIVQASALQSQKSHLDHVDLPYEGEFGSIHMNEGTVPSQAELPSAIGESAAEGFEKLKDMAQPQIAKAKEAITHLKDSMTSGSSGSSSAGGASTLDQAKAKMSDLTAQAKDLYTEKIQPQIEAVQPQLEDLKTKVVEKTNELKQRATSKSVASQQPGLEHRAIKTYHAPGHQQQPETMQHRMIRYRNKAMEIWAGQEPMLRARSQQALRWVRKNRMEVPLLALGTLLVLWASLSFIGWIAWPGQYSPVREQMVVYNPHQAAVPIHDTLVNGPSQNVEGPSTIDKMKMSMGDSMDDIKMKTMDRLQHAMPSMPSLDSVKDAMPSVDDVKNAMPSMNDVKDAMPSMNDVKDAMPSMQGMKYAPHMPNMQAAPSLNSLKESIVDAIPSVDQVKDAMPSMDAARVPDMNAMKESVMNAASDIKDAMPASAGGIMNRMKEGVQHIKERINVATGAASKHTTQQATTPAHEPNTPPHLHTQPQQIPIDLAQMNAGDIAAGDDINAPPHLHNDVGGLHQA